MKVGWEHIVAAAAASGVLVLLLVAFIWRCCCYNYKLGNSGAGNRGSERLQLHTGIARLHQPALHQIDLDSSYGVKTHRKGNYGVFRRGVSTKPLFSWADHPSLITDAVENGWSMFGFAGYMTSSPSTRSSALLGLCAAGDGSGRLAAEEVEIGWEICQGSADFMQKIRLNSGFKKVMIGAQPWMAAAAAVRTALPLPGPPLSFPQEAYFEITVLYSGDGDDGDQFSGKVIREGEKAKLIQQNSNPKANSESLVHISGSHGIKSVDDMSSHGGKFEAVVVSIGLTGGGSLPLKLPGSYPGSIGFNSNGSVYLDGIKLVFESEKAEWGRKDQVIGCGFDPRNKKVFFTVDSEVAHVFHCQPEEFGAPLYPTLAANNDIIVLVNFGQSAFTYAPANAHRTPNPCFVAPLASSPAAAAALGYDDSRELFSMGRIDSQWLNRCTTKGSLHNGNNNDLTEDFDAESEADLFEIVLESSGKSPNNALVTPSKD